MDGIHEGGTDSVRPARLGEGESDGAILARMGTDAAAWAREMAAAAREVAARERDVDALTLDEALSLMWDEAPGDFLHVWLVNAIEAGRGAGYAQGRRDAEEGVRWMADHLESDGDPVRRDVAADMRERLTGWPLVPVGEPPLPADLAGRTQPEDSAARPLPADLAGRDDAIGQAKAREYADAKARFEEAWRKHAAEGPHVILEQHDADEEPSPIARAADALEQIAETLRSVVRPLNGGVSYPAVRVVRS